eukprot:m.64322 g.64322  ORF g.64322 m.64322 type:complete len:116 (+) comp49707_c0_seq2:68-415(+)
MGGSGSKNKGEEKPSKKASVKESKKEERSKSVKETKSEKAKEVPIFAAPTEPPKAIDVEKHETKAIKGRLAAGVDTSHLKSGMCPFFGVRDVLVMRRTFILDGSSAPPSIPPFPS